MAVKHSIRCLVRKNDKETGGEDKESGGEEKAFAVANMWSQDSSQVKVVGLSKCLIHYAVRWHGDLFILSK